MLSALALFCFLPTVAYSSSPRIVAVGDVHGDFESLVEILEETEIINSRQQWIGGETLLLQTGDFTDRGTRTREVMDFLMRLEDQAEDEGGKVYILLGNHEVMNLTGDLRYVTPEIFSTFVEGDSEEARRKAAEKYAGWKIRRMVRRSPDEAIPPEEEIRRDWLERHPIGFLEYRESLAPEGRYGRWLRELPAVKRIGEILFTHGGISPQLPFQGEREVNRRIRREIEAFQKYTRYLIEKGLFLPFLTFEEMVHVAREELASEKRSIDSTHGTTRQVLESFLKMGSWLSIHQDGPLWFRGFATWSDGEAATLVPPLLEEWDVSHFVVSHTPSGSHEIVSRLGGKIFLLETGLPREVDPKGRPSALEIQGGRFSAIYPGERHLLLDRPQ